jgi:hypothetical protein
MVSWSITKALAGCKAVSDAVRRADHLIDSRDDAIGRRLCVVDLLRYLSYGPRSAGWPGYPIIGEVQHVFSEVGSIISYVIYIALQAIAISRHGA